jgi:HEPN domain-containing protein
MTETAKKRVEYWLGMARYDLISAKAMLQTKRFLYVGFMCHQVAEKCA